MYYPHADDEIVAMGYANYNNRIQEEDGMVTIDPKAFRTYMFVNYIEKLDRNALLDLLGMNIETSVLVDLAQNIWDLPFTVAEDNTISLVDANELLLKHSEGEHLEGCSECDEDDDDYDIITNDDDWGDDEFAPYDELDENLEE
jgi:hypothetical protein